MRSSLASFAFKSPLLFSIAVCACGSAEAPPLATNDRSSSEELGQAAQPIVGGDTDREHLAVLAIATITPGIEALCTGTLIAPNLVLTARHCVVPTASRFVDCGETTFEDPYDVEALWVTPSTSVRNAELFPVRQVAVPPDDTESCGADIALLILDGEFSARIPIMAPRLDTPARRGEAVTAVGFGSALSEGAPGIRRAIGDVEVLCGPADCNTPDLLSNTEFMSAQGACEGDSGGPALDSEERVVGVASRTNEECTFAVYSAISPWSEWIVNVAELALSQGEYEAPSWLDAARDADVDLAGPGSGGFEDDDLADNDLAGEDDLQPPSGMGALPDDELVSSSGDSGCSASGARQSSLPSPAWLALSVAAIALRVGRRGSRPSR